MSFASDEYALHQAIHAAPFADALLIYISARRWFGGKSRTIAQTHIHDVIALPANSPLAYLCTVLLSYADGGEDTYLLPLAFAAGPQAEALRRTTPQAIIASAEDFTGDGVIFDAVYAPAFCSLLLGSIERGERFAGSEGMLLAEPTAAFASLRGLGELAPRISLAEQSNTSVIYGDKLILKLFRRVVPGLNPDLEIGRYLTEQGQFGQIAPVAGSLSYATRTSEPVTLGMVLGFVANRGDAWSFMLELLAPLAQLAYDPPVDAAQVPADIPAPLARSLQAVQVLGQRSAEMHCALGAPTDEAAFAPESFSQQQAEAEVAAMNSLADTVFRTARTQLARQPADVHAILGAILEHEAAIRRRFSLLAAGPLTALRTRAHGDYHLGQVLATTHNDFVIIDFEGEPARSLEERRAKRSPLRDVAGMLRSFDYVAATALHGDDRREAWATWWVAAASNEFLRSYLATAGDAAFLPKTEAERANLLDAYLIEKAVYELQYELNNRPTWIRIPAQGILRLVQQHE